MKYVFFDLDGTITDPKEGITKSVEYSLKNFGISVSNLDDLCKFIGPPLSDSYEEFYGFTKEQAKEAIAWYRVYYSKKGIFQCELYRGISELISHLYNKDIKVVLATSKPTEYAIDILKHFEIYKYFDYISGSAMDGSIVNKDDIINQAVEHYKKIDGDFDESQVVMIGDRKFDYIGASKCNIKCILISYGYGEMEELLSCQPFALKKSVEELQEFLDSI